MLSHFFSKHTVAQGFSTPKPGESHKIFGADEGTWKCEVGIYINGPDGPPEKYTATDVNKLVSSGFYLKWESKSKMVDQDFEGHGLIGYKPKKKRYDRMWVDNFIEAPTRMAGRYNKVKKIFIVTGNVQDQEGSVMKRKRVTTHLDDMAKRFEIFLVVEADDKEMEIKLMSMKQ
ncbi:MAG: DUF1579 family protein [Planctomycetota bacterium]|nr:DUF1579 family protein [Planctomycetota bacterium]